MPAVVTQFIDTYAHTPARRPAFIFAGAGLLLGAAAWSVMGGTVQASSVAASGTRPLYPSTAPVITMIDVPNLTVLQVVHKLPITSRYDILLSNTGVKQQLSGMGPYTLFAPADNYFDYLPKGAYAALTRQQELELAAHMVVSDAAIDPSDDNGPYVTLAEDQLPVSMQDGAVMVGGSMPDGSQGFAIRGYRANNGIVYVVNKVLPPDDLVEQLQ